jgi:monofunctional biosynthetic peptidoglycan transglycosylase
VETEKRRATVRQFFKSLRRVFILLFWLHLFYIVVLKWVYPPITMTQFVSWVSGHGLKRNYVSYASMSPNAGLAVIAAEDQLFPDHSGFDWKSIEKARRYNERKPGRIRGASTISQQVAKNVFLWQGRSWIRKAFEVYFTFMIEVLWGKQRILDMYLNVVETGDGVFGFEAAAIEYFNKPAASLSKQEAALIAAVLPSPKRYRIKPLSAFVSARAGNIQRQMNNLLTDPDIRRVIGIGP